MCRNIRTLFHFEPPATQQEVHAASLQFVRKVSGFHAPSQANQVAFDLAVERVAECVHDLLGSLQTKAKPRNREEELVKARERAKKRFGTGPSKTSQTRDSRS